MSGQDHPINARVSEAWKAHRKGDNATAIAQFSEVLSENPENVDALWGLGLAYRYSGDAQNALETFGKARALITAELENETEQFSRFSMLQRMVSQQIEQISADSSSNP